MQEVFATINKLSSTDANILILGENGTGKDVIARLLYRCSPRYGKPFVTIDLGSIPEQAAHCDRKTADQPLRKHTGRAY